MTDQSKRDTVSQSAPPGVTEPMRRRAFPVSRHPDDSADAERLLRIYLGDHFAGSTGGLNLARRAASNHRGGAHGLPLSAIAEEIAEDRRTLRRIMDDLDVTPPPAKVTLAWVMERAARLKPNGRLLGRSPLSSVIELESLRMGVEGKSSCWRTLRALADNDHRLSARALDELVDRAEDQARRLEEIRVGVVTDTFNPSDRDAGTQWQSSAEQDRAEGRRS